MKTFFHILLIFIFCTSQVSLASSEIYGPFDARKSVFLNKYKTSHELAKVFLSLDRIHPKFTQASQKILQMKPFALPQFKIQNKKLFFTFEGKNYQVQHIKKSIYLLNDQKIDFIQDNWVEDLSSASLPVLDPLLFNTAYAIPIMGLYYVILIGAVVLGGGCAASSLNQLKPKTLGAKWVRVPSNQFNRQVNKLLKEALQLCGAANASSIGQNYDFHQFINNYCSQLGSRAMEIYKKKGRQNSSQELLSTQVLRYSQRRPQQIAPIAFVENYLKTNSLRSCLDPSCTKPQKNTAFAELDDSQQETLKTFMSDPAFTSACLELGLDTADASSEGGTQRQEPLPPGRSTH